MWCTWRNLASPPNDWWDLAFRGGTVVTWHDICLDPASGDARQNSSVYSSAHIIYYKYISSSPTQRCNTDISLTAKSLLKNNSVQINYSYPDITLFLAIRTNVCQEQNSFSDLKFYSYLDSYITQEIEVSPSLKFYVYLKCNLIQIVEVVCDITARIPLEAEIYHSSFSNSNIKFIEAIQGELLNRTNAGSTYPFIEAEGTTSTYGGSEGPCAYVTQIDWGNMPLWTFSYVSGYIYRETDKFENDPVFVVCYDRETAFVNEPFDYSPSVQSTSLMTSNPPYSDTVIIGMSDWDLIELWSDIFVDNNLYRVTAKYSSEGNYYLDLNRNANLLNEAFTYRTPYTKLATYDVVTCSGSQKTISYAILAVYSPFIINGTNVTSSQASLGDTKLDHFSSGIWQGSYNFSELTTHEPNVGLHASVFNNSYIDAILDDGKDSLESYLSQVTYSNAVLTGPSITGRLIANIIQNSSSGRNFLVRCYPPGSAFNLLTYDNSVSYEVLIEETEVTLIVGGRKESCEVLLFCDVSQVSKINISALTFCTPGGGIPYINLGTDTNTITYDVVVQDTPDATLWIVEDVVVPFICETYFFCFPYQYTTISSSLFTTSKLLSTTSLETYSTGNPTFCTNMSFFVASKISGIDYEVMAQTPDVTWAVATIVICEAYLFADATQNMSALVYEAYDKEYLIAETYHSSLVYGRLSHCILEFVDLLTKDNDIIYNVLLEQPEIEWYTYGMQFVCETYLFIDINQKTYCFPSFTKSKILSSNVISTSSCFSDLEVLNKLESFVVQISSFDGFINRIKLSADVAERSSSLGTIRTNLLFLEAFVSHSNFCIAEINDVEPFEASIYQVDSSYAFSLVEATPLFAVLINETFCISSLTNNVKLLFSIINQKTRVFTYIRIGESLESSCSHSSYVDVTFIPDAKFLKSNLIQNSYLIERLVIVERITCNIQQTQYSFSYFSGVEDIVSNIIQGSFCHGIIENKNGFFSNCYQHINSSGSLFLSNKLLLHSTINNNSNTISYVFDEIMIAAVVNQVSFCNSKIVYKEAISTSTLESNYFICNLETPELMEGEITQELYSIGDIDSSADFYSSILQRTNCIAYLGNVFSSNILQIDYTLSSLWSFSYINANINHENLVIASLKTDKASFSCSVVQETNVYIYCYTESFIRQTVSECSFAYARFANKEPVASISEQNCYSSGILLTNSISLDTYIYQNNYAIAKAIIPGTIRVPYCPEIEIIMGQDNYVIENIDDINVLIEDSISLKQHRRCIEISAYSPNLSIKTYYSCKEYTEIHELNEEDNDERSIEVVDSDDNAPLITETNGEIYELWCKEMDINLYVRDLNQKLLSLSIEVYEENIPLTIEIVDDGHDLKITNYNN